MKRRFVLICFVLFLGCSKDEIVPFHQALDKSILDKMGEYNIPGVSLAVVKDEKLVYAHSYGLAIKESQTIASNNHLYRLASISKVVTAISILKLASDEALSLDQTVFGINGILGNDYGVPMPDSKIDQITIRHFISHTSGWTNDPYDLVFSQSAVSQEELITTLVTNRPLTKTPGSTYYYFNMGYVILGRVIEKITGEAYEDYVTANILNPAGITNMKIGGSTLAERDANEVRYYNHLENIEAPYVLNLRRMAGAAGWICSATDLARLMIQIDKGTNKPDIIPQALLDQFYFKSSSWYHDGLLPGNSCITALLNSSFTIVILTNSGNHASIIDLYDTVKAQVPDIDWPDDDLF
jgi:CubicO group peptidase (beta-lactamase class C family)